MSSFQEVDGTLQHLVEVANTQQNGFAFGITLGMSCGMVTGKLIPNHVWMAEMADIMQVASGKEEESPFALFFNQYKELFAPDESSDSDADGEYSDEPYTNHIHLREARFFVGTSMAPQEGSHWRGRLVDVAGWSVGNLSIGGQQ